MIFVDVLHKIRLNLKAIWKLCVFIWSAAAFVAGVVGSWNALPCGLKFIGENIVYKILFLLFIGMVIFVFSYIIICYVIKNNVIWEKGSSAIILRYDDIFRLAIDTSGRHIVTIPVNDAFDTIVDDNPTLIEYPLVSSKTIHGKWIKMMLDRGVDLEFIDRKINEGLFFHQYKPIMRALKKRGKLRSYPIGTVSYVSGPRNVFFALLVISKFDENNKAHASADEIQKALVELLIYYDEHGQGYDLYIPILGVGLSRSNLTPQEALEMIKSTLLANKWRIHGKIYIVVYEKDKSNVSIFV